MEILKSQAVFWQVQEQVLIYYLKRLKYNFTQIFFNLDDMGLGKTLQTISVVWTLLKQVRQIMNDSYLVYLGIFSKI
jgi:SNF2 family DNA or RNA helicase